MTGAAGLPYQQKSQSFESFLDQLNNALVPGFGDPAVEGEPYLSAQITGLPRSGTTILNQLLARTGVVGYVSNTMALYWRVPTVGARIQRYLATAGGTLSSQSLAGRTPEPLDPHEFGYFWRTALGHSANSVLRDTAPWPSGQLQRVLDAVTLVFDMPVVYKNFLVLAHAAELRQNLSRVRFVLTQRAENDIAASLFSLYDRLGPNSPAMIGLQPPPGPARPDETLHDRIAYQVRSLSRLVAEGHYESSPDAIVVSYPDLCRRPREIVEDILHFVDADVAGVRWQDLPRQLAQSNASDALAPDDRRAIVRALERVDRFQQ